MKEASGLVADGVRDFNAGRLKAALDSFRRAVRLAKGDPRPLCLAAHCEAALGRRGEAAAAFARALRLDPGHAPAALGLANLRRASGRLAEAERVLAAARRRLPADPALREAFSQTVRARALAAKKADRFDEAKRRWTDLLRVRPKDAEALRELEELALKKARSQAAKRTRARDLESAQAVLAEVLRARASRAGKTGRAARASRLWNKAETLGPAADSQRADRFRALALIGRYEEAFALGERILDAGASLKDIRAFWHPWEPEDVPRIREKHLALLRRLCARAKTPWPLYCLGALSEEEIPEFDPVKGFDAARYGWMWFKVGHLYLVRGKIDRAVPWLDRAAKKPPVDWRIFGFLAEALLCQGRPLKEGLAALAKAESFVPPEEAAQVVAWRGALLLWLGRYREALRALDAACAQGANWAYCWRAGAKIKLGFMKEALADLDKALAIHAGDREARVWRGEALRELGRLREAERALTMTPMPQWAHFNRGLVRARLGDKRGLVEDYRAIHDGVAGYIRKKLRFPAHAEPTPARMRAVLAAGLRLSLGYRHSNFYGNRFWMR